MHVGHLSMKNTKISRATAFLIRRMPKDLVANCTCAIKYNINCLSKKKERLKSHVNLFQAVNIVG